MKSTDHRIQDAFKQGLKILERLETAHNNLKDLLPVLLQVGGNESFCMFLQRRTMEDLHVRNGRILSLLGTGEGRPVLHLRRTV